MFQTTWSKRKGTFVEEGRFWLGILISSAVSNVRVTSPVTGNNRDDLKVTGQVTLREPPFLLRWDAYIEGIVEERLFKGRRSCGH